MYGYILSRIAMLLAVVLLFAAVLWQTYHVIEWCGVMYRAHGDGTLAGYLRWHAKVYVDYLLGLGVR